MSGPVSDVLLAEITHAVRQHGLVVWLDRQGHYSAFVDALPARRGAGAPAFPVAAYRGSCAAYSAGGSHGATSGSAGWVPSLAPTDIALLPLDPAPFNPDGCYVYASNGLDYKLMILHTMEFPDSRSPYYDSGRSSTYGYSTPGGANW